MIKCFNEPLNFINTITNDFIIFGQSIIDVLLELKPNNFNILTHTQINVFLNFLKENNIEYKAEEYLEFIYNNNTYKIFSKNDEYRECLKYQKTTMNALAINSEGKLIDYFNGLDDINNKVIKLIDNNFIYKDNKLMIKLIRYSAEYGFKLDDDLLEIINKHSPNIILVSTHVIRDELIKILMSDHPEYIKDLEKYGLLKYIIPELHLCFHTPQENPWHIYNVGDHTIEVLKNTPKDYDIRVAALLHDVGKCFCKRIGPDGIAHFYGHPKISKEKASDIFERLYFPQKDIKVALTLIDLHDNRLEPKLKSVRKFIIKYKPSDELFRKLLKLQYADIKGQNPEKTKESLDNLNKVLEIYENYKKNELTYKDLEITGKELINEGIDRRKIKPILDLLIEYISIDITRNNKKDLIKYAKDNQKKIKV